MSKNNCCKICGRLDYDDNGEYLVCRVCGEKRKKYQNPLIECALTVLFALCGAGSSILAMFAHAYRTGNTDSAVVNLIKPDVPGHLNTGPYSPFEVFMQRNEAQLIWIEPLFWVIGIAFIVLAVVFFNKMRERAKKKIF